MHPTYHDNLLCQSAHTKSNQPQPDAKRTRHACCKRLQHTSMDNAMQRLRQRHGQGIAATAISLSLNLDALRTLSRNEAERAINLAASVKRGHAWRRDRLHFKLSDADYALLAFVMSSDALPDQHPEDAAPAAPEPAAAAAQVAAAEPLVADAQQEHAVAPEPQEPPSTISRSRSRAS